MEQRFNEHKLAKSSIEGDTTISINASMLRYAKAGLNKITLQLTDETKLNDNSLIVPFVVLLSAKIIDHSEEQNANVENPTKYQQNL